MQGLFRRPSGIYFLRIAVSGIPQDMVEAQLGHGKAGPLGSAYDRAEYLPQRQRMMQTWTDYLDKRRSGAEVIQLKTA